MKKILEEIEEIERIDFESYAGRLNNFEPFKRLKQILTPTTSEEIIKELTPHYEKFYPGFIKIKITKTGIYAIRDTVVEGKEKPWIIFSMHGGIIGNRVCSHLTLEQIQMCSTFFMNRSDG